ncbi:unnamed protein product, partial [marine sediment metagenome]
DRIRAPIISRENIWQGVNPTPREAEERADN